jgi:hypothetical protein
VGSGYDILLHGDPGLDVLLVLFLGAVYLLAGILWLYRRGSWERGLEGAAVERVYVLLWVGMIVGGPALLLTWIVAFLLRR